MSKQAHPNSLLLSAGALLNPEAELPEGEAADLISARTYSNPALGDRRVVRLCPDSLAQGEDITMGILGFGPPEIRAGIALRRRRALGFPGWALIHDPANARFALEVMRDLKKHARKARSKPGHAKEGFDAIGERLGRTVPHFLPSYYEEVGRVFLENGNVSYSAQAFNKAREAEKVHALPVDEHFRRESFLEFALCGAISIKAISEYAKDLEKSWSPSVAFGHFRELCVRRTLGGMPPWSGMAKDLRRLSKAAGLSQADEDRRFLEEVLESPAVTKAAPDFWASYESALGTMARQSATIAGLLLNLFPSPSSGDTDKFNREWLALLERWGVLKTLWEPADATPPEAQPIDGPTGWLHRFLGFTARSWRGGGLPPEIMGLVRRMAPRMISDGKGLQLHAESGWRTAPVDLDLCDLLLELGVPLEDPAEGASINLEHWKEPAFESTEWHRDPVHAAADPRFYRLLVNAIDDVFGDEVFEKLAFGKKGLMEARKTWLEEQVSGVANRGLIELAASCSRLIKATSSQTFAEFPQAYEALQAVDVSLVLGRVLRRGVFDELGWDEYGQAIEELRVPEDEEATVTGAFPHLVLYHDGRALVLGPKGREAAFDIKVPKSSHVRGFRYVQGQLLSVWYSYDDSETRGCWSGNPNETFLAEEYGSLGEVKMGLILGDGSLTEGDRALSAGDTVIPSTRDFIGDGEHLWFKDHGEKKHLLREYDPRTGEQGRLSMPSWFEDFLIDGLELNLSRSWMLPLPEGLERSPFGTARGLLGRRVRSVRRDDDGNPLAPETLERSERIDGIAFPMETADSDHTDGLLDLPGAQVLVEEGWRGATLWSADGAFKLAQIGESSGPFSRGTRHLPPFEFWHFLRPRDEQGSLALRAISDQQASVLLRCAKEEADTTEIEEEDDDQEAIELPLTKTLLEETLPSITDPSLKAGVLGVIARAAVIDNSLRQHLLKCAPGTFAEADSDSSALFSDDLREAMAPVLGRMHGYGHNDVGKHLKEITAFFSGESAPGFITPSDFDLRPLIGRETGLVFITAAWGTPESSRSTVLSLLDVWSKSPMAREPAKFRVYGAKFGKGKVPVSGFKSNDYEARAATLEMNGNRYLLIKDSYSDEGEVDVLEYAPEGTFKLPGPCEINDEKTCPSRGTLDLEAWTTALQTLGPWQRHDPIPGLIAEATGLSKGEAALFWAGLPGLRSYDRNFISKECREAMGLKVTEALAARESLKRLSTERLDRFFSAFLGQEPAEFWSTDGAALAGRFSRCWIEVFGKRVPIPDTLLVEAGKELEVDIATADWLAIIADPSNTPFLNIDRDWVVFSDASIQPSEGPKAPAPGDQEKSDEGEEEEKEEPISLDGESIGCLAKAIPFLFEKLPVGDPLRDKLPLVHELILARLGNPGLILSAGSWYREDDEDDEKAIKKANQAFLTSFGGETIFPPDPPRAIDEEQEKPPEKTEGRDNGVLIVIPSSWSFEVLLRPARLGALLDPASESVLDRASEDIQPLHQGIRLLRSAGYTDMIQRVTSSPVTPGQYEANPLQSVPTLVRRVQARHELSENAAVLYLQTLSLRAPTTRNIQLWNGWTPAIYKKAAAELTEKKLLTEAKRARAGRGHFLPGGWEELKSPDLPMESWKLPLYGVTRAKDRSLKMPLNQILPLAPLHQLFEQAWERIEQGDLPRYESLR